MGGYGGGGKSGDSCCDESDDGEEGEGRWDDVLFLGWLLELSVCLAVGQVRYYEGSPGTLPGATSLSKHVKRREPHSFTYI